MWASPDLTILATGYDHGGPPSRSGEMKEYMHRTIRRPAPQQWLAIAVVSTFGLLGPSALGQTNHRVAIPALAASQLDDTLRGLVLVEEFNCVACHTATASIASTSRQAPRLSAVGTRVNPYYLEQFIQTPHATKPGTTMPDVMAHMAAGEKQQAARAITHFLLSLNTTRPFQPQAIDTVAAELGQELFHTVGCVACHAPRNADGDELLVASSVPLGALETKYHPQSLAEFLQAPHKTRPSGRMPDMRLNGRDAERIAHYLLRKTQVPGHLHYTMLRGRVWEGLEVNVTKEKSGHADNFDLNSVPPLPTNSALQYQGYLNVESAGEYTFFLTMNGGQLSLNEQEVVNLEPSSRRGVKMIQAAATLTAGWNAIGFTYIHAGKEPRLVLEFAGPGLTRQAIGAERLSISPTPIAPYRPYHIDATLLSEGRRQFARLGCVRCHDDVKITRDATVTSDPRIAWGDLQAGRGCLSDNPGPAPRFQLASNQRDLLRPLLGKIDIAKFTRRERLHKSLVTFNCIGCHERAELGGVSAERNAYFVGSKKELGNQGRIPPPLTLVGAKLQTTWMKEVMLRGQQQRDYLATRMPQFGESNVGHLIELFEEVDALEETTFAEIKDVDQTKLAGHTLVGTTGLSCIACHDFNGQKASGPGAMDIIHATERLKKNWFYLYLLNPARFQPGTIMPAAWPGGHSFKQDILGGDTQRQIESIWVYLEDGIRAKNPIGLSRKSPELRVTDEPVICRGRGNAGYRGIAVGYPERLSLAFDSQEMNLRLLWKGDFVTADAGRFSARGRNRIEFPPGIPFHRLKSLEDNWPYKRKTDYLFPQDHGYRFRGYQLDRKKRPTFIYDYGDMRVEDYFEDILDEAKNAYFRRTLTFESPAAQEMFYFRAAAGGTIRQQAAAREGAKAQTTFVADQVTIRIAGPQQAMVREGEPQELLIPLQVPQGRSTFVLEYRW